MADVNPGARNFNPDRTGLSQIIFIAIMIAGQNLIRIVSARPPSANPLILQVSLHLDKKGTFLSSSTKKP